MRQHRTANPLGRTPWPLAAAAIVAVGFLLIPLVGLLAGTPWRDLGSLITRPTLLAPLRLSLLTATAATVLAMLVGLPLGWVLANGRSRWTPWLRALVTLPLVLPPVVGGVALLLAYGRMGLLGSPVFSWFGWSLPFSTAAVVVAETFVAMPFLVISVEGSLRSVPRGIEEAAATLGSSRWFTFTRVTVPQIAPGLGAGAVLCWARALGEFGATITFAGNLPGVTQTMPLAIYRAFEVDPSEAVALSVVLLGVCVAVLLLLRDRWLRPGSSW